MVSASKREVKMTEIMLKMSEQEAEAFALGLEIAMNKVDKQDWRYAIWGQTLLALRNVTGAMR
jgi:hypothetical protein